MPKVNKTIISIAKRKAIQIEVGDKVVSLANDKDIRSILSIDVTDNATYIELQDDTDRTYTCGAKVFIDKFKLIGSDWKARCK